MHTEAGSRLRHAARKLQLHNPKAGHLVKKPARTGIFGEVVGAGFR